MRNVTQCYVFYSYAEYLVNSQFPVFPHDTYGSQTQQSGTSQTVFGFTGEETDSNGLVNLRTRYYNPAIGQFFSQDPLEGSAVQPLSLGRYAYVVGNPINFKDPSGLQIECLDPPCEGSGSTFVIPFENGGGWIIVPPEGTIVNESVGDMYFKYGDNYEVYSEGILATDAKALFATIEEYAANSEASIVLQNNVSHGGQVAEVEAQTEFGRRAFLFAYNDAQVLKGYIEYIGNATINTYAVAPAWYMFRDPYHKGQPVNPGDPSPKPNTDCQDQAQNGPCGKLWTDQYPADLLPLPSNLVMSQRPSLERDLNATSTLGFIYVISREGKLLMVDPAKIQAQYQRKVNHPDLVNGNPVVYAGVMRFKQGQLIGWDRESGHYLPNPNGDSKISECVRQLLINLPEWKLGNVPPEGSF